MSSGQFLMYSGRSQWGGSLCSLCENARHNSKMTRRDRRGRLGLCQAGQALQLCLLYSSGRGQNTAIHEGQIVTCEACGDQVRSPALSTDGEGV